MNRQQQQHEPKLQIAVLGGGIAGLASAYYLQQAGFTPVVLEATDSLGGLGSDFVHEDVSIERFYHVMINSDVHLLSLLDELDLTSRIHWQSTGMGFHVNGKLYPFNTPLDLLRFGGLAPADRLRTGFAALKLSKRRNGDGLDEIPVDQFLREQFGNRAFETIWRPLLMAKFGNLYPSVPAYWFWSRMCREKNGAPEVKGHIRGGYRGIVNALETAIVQGGGIIRRNAKVDRVRDNSYGVQVRVNGIEQAYDAAVSTLPLPLLARVADGDLRGQVPLPDLTYQGVVNVVVVSRQRIQPYYWNAVLDPRFTFQGIVETSNVIPRQWTGGRHISYLMNYCQPTSERYNMSDRQLQGEALDGLTTLYPHFRRESVEATYVFRAPYVEPVWSLGFLKQRPGVQVGNTSVFLATTAQAYPMVNSWNTSVGLARQTVEQVTRTLSQSRRGDGLQLVGA